VFGVYSDHMTRYYGRGVANHDLIICLISWHQDRNITEDSWLVHRLSYFDLHWVYVQCVF